MQLDNLSKGFPAEKPFNLVAHSDILGRLVREYASLKELEMMLMTILPVGSATVLLVGSPPEGYYLHDSTRTVAADGSDTGRYDPHALASLYIYDRGNGDDRDDRNR